MSNKKSYSIKNHIAPTKGSEIMEFLRKAIIKDNIVIVKNNFNDKSEEPSLIHVNYINLNKAMIAGRMCEFNMSEMVLGERVTFNFSNLVSYELYDENKNIKAKGLF